MPKKGSPRDLSGGSQKLGGKRGKTGTEKDFSTGISTAKPPALQLESKGRLH